MPVFGLGEDGAWRHQGTAFSHFLEQLAGAAVVAFMSDQKPPSVITTEEARALAARWAAHVGGNRLAFLDAIPAPLTADERERLFAWVRARMAADCTPGRFATLTIRSGLGGAREILAFGVGMELGGAHQPGTGGWHSLSLDLCNAAGWPS